MPGARGHLRYIQRDGEGDRAGFTDRRMTRPTAKRSSNGRRPIALDHLERAATYEGERMRAHPVVVDTLSALERAKLERWTQPPSSTANSLRQRHLLSVMSDLAGRYVRRLPRGGSG